MALICMSPNRLPDKGQTRGSGSGSDGAPVVNVSQQKKHPKRRFRHRKVHRRVEQADGGAEGEEEEMAEDCDSGCECGSEETEELEVSSQHMWSRTMTAVRVLTVFKKKQRKKAEQQEHMMKEKRRTLWRRLGFKLRIFNIFANKMKNEDPKVEAIFRLKRKLGDITVASKVEANRYQHKIEQTLQMRLEVDLKPGDMILTSFDNLQGKKKKKATKVFERTLSFDDSNPRAGRSRGGTSGGQGKLREVLKDLDSNSTSRRLSWHNEDFSNYFIDFNPKPKYRSPHIAPLVIISIPVPEKKTPKLTLPVQTLQTEPVDKPSSPASPTSSPPASPGPSGASSSTPVTRRFNPPPSPSASTRSIPSSPARSPSGPPSPTTPPPSPYRHYIHEFTKDGQELQRRPSIVSRNIKKMFGKS